MPNSDYFNNALHDMVFENACGAAIRRLADMRMPISYIMRELDYPISFDMVQRYVWKHYLDKKILIYIDDSKINHEQDGYIIIEDSPKEKIFIKEQGPYGKVSYRQVTIDKIDSDSAKNNSLAYLKQAGTNNGREDEADTGNRSFQRYAPCDFGIMKHVDPQRFDELLSRLDTLDRAYIEDLPWENKRIYHIMNERMTSIVDRCGGLEGLSIHN